MCRSAWSPLAFWSSSASRKSLRMFSSLWPTNLLSTSGPLTILGSRVASILPICLAMSVLPVPGGPNSRMPLTCLMPSCCTSLSGKMREAKARRNSRLNSESRPPMPMSSNLKFLGRKLFFFSLTKVRYLLGGSLSISSSVISLSSSPREARTVTPSLLLCALLSPSRWGISRSLTVILSGVPM